MQPFHIKTEEKKNDYGRFVIEPLEQGYGYTLGNALRRVMLTSLPGAAITQVKVSGLKHQFGSLPGVKEDGVELILNLKRIRVSYQGEKPTKITLSARGKGSVTASQIKAPADVTIGNPDLVIANLADSGSKLDVEMQVEAGIGYSTAEEKKTGTIGLIPVDATFSPVTRVNYKVEETRVGRLTNYDKLIMEVWTDATISPEDALKRAANVLVSYFQQVVSPKEPEVSPKKAEETSPLVAKLSVEELGLPTRIANALVRAGYETVGDLMAADRKDLAKVRNLGEKSVKVVDTALKEKGVSLGA